jgi:hypothetical protein
MWLDDPAIGTRGDQAYQNDRRGVVHVIAHAGLEHAEHVGRKPSAQPVSAERAQGHTKTLC